MINIKDHKLVSLLPSKVTNTRQLRKSKMFFAPTREIDRLLFPIVPGRNYVSQPF